MSETICKKCGKPVKADDKFCAACGASVRTGEIKANAKVSRRFKNAHELAEYLNTIEERLENLEVENRRLKKRIRVETRGVSSDIDYIYEIFPVTNLLSKSFIKRAFAVWGHFFVANLLISIVLGILYFFLFVSLLTSVVSSSM